MEAGCYHAFRKAHIRISVKGFQRNINLKIQLARDLWLQRDWFQDHRGLPLYDLVRTRREAALKLGATSANRNLTVVNMRERREELKFKTVQAEIL